MKNRGEKMNILIIGLGVIGTTYGYLFKKAGFNVEHYIRKNKTKIRTNILYSRKVNNFVKI